MFDPARPYSFHIELTDKCNAGCPMCPRTLHLDRCRTDRSVVANVELGLTDFQTHFTDAFCAQTEEVIFGGAYGDPLAATELLEVVEHLTDRGVRVAIATNGSLRKPDWWARMGRAMVRTGSRLELHIDGLEDTNPLYRVGTFYDKIAENAAAYIETGARAEWHFIIFRHNEHQIEEAFRRSRALGFQEFTLIDTVRFGPEGVFPYQMPDGAMRSLEAPRRKAADFALEDGEIMLASRQDAEEAAREISPFAINGIDCKSAARNSPYISAHGQVSACCWVTGAVEERDFFGRHGLAPDRFNLRNRPLAEIMHDEPFASFYAEAWREDSLPTCRHKCGKMRRNRRNAL
ncbi:MAG: radical SAM protein [Pseudomonadota bacterium]